MIEHWHALCKLIYCIIVINHSRHPCRYTWPCDKQLFFHALLETSKHRPWHEVLGTNLVKFCLVANISIARTLKLRETALQFALGFMFGCCDFSSQKNFVVQTISNTVVQVVGTVKGQTRTCQPRAGLADPTWSTVSEGALQLFTEIVSLCSLRHSSHSPIQNLSSRFWP